MLAACLDRPVQVAAHEEAGAAGRRDDGGRADRDVRRHGRLCRRLDRSARGRAPLLPDPALAARYDRLFPMYRDAYHAMPALWRQLHAAREETTHAS